MAMFGDFASKNKRKLSKEELEKKAKKVGFSQPSTFKLPELVIKKGK